MPDSAPLRTLIVDDEPLAIERMQILCAEQPVVFLLWGAYAQKKAAFVDTSKHLVLKAAHPSPLSVHNGFLGCRHFSKCNAFLESKGLPPIDWSLPEV